MNISSPDCLHGGLTFLSPSLGSALRDCVRLFAGPVEGAISLATPGENLHSPQRNSKSDSQEQMGRREISRSERLSGKQQG